LVAQGKAAMPQPWENAKSKNIESNLINNKYEQVTFNHLFGDDFGRLHVVFLRQEEKHPNATGQIRDKSATI
jgi:hypothetical protein